MMSKQKGFSISLLVQGPKSKALFYKPGGAQQQSSQAWWLAYCCPTQNGDRTGCWSTCFELSLRYLKLPLLRKKETLMVQTLFRADTETKLPV